MYLTSVPKYRTACNVIQNNIQPQYKTACNVVQNNIHVIDWCS